MFTCGIGTLGLRAVAESLRSHPRITLLQFACLSFKHSVCVASAKQAPRLLTEQCWPWRLQLKQCPALRLCSASPLVSANTSLDVGGGEDGRALLALVETHPALLDLGFSCRDPVVNGLIQESLKGKSSHSRVRPDSMPHFLRSFIFAPQLGSSAKVQVVGPAPSWSVRQHVN
jgi:hypothetical protein